MVRLFLWQAECSLASAIFSDCLARIYCDIAYISILRSLTIFSPRILSSLTVWSLSWRISLMTLCSKSSILCLREVKLLSIDSEFEVKTPSRSSNSEETVPPTVFMMSILTSFRRFDKESLSPPALLTS